MKERHSFNTSISDIRFIDVPFYPDENGDLSVLECGVNVPFTIMRVFVVRAGNGSIRGNHAHKSCTQILICPNGLIEISCDDGQAKTLFVIDNPDKALLIPPGIWAEQKYIGDETVLTVMCDELYDSNDYISDYPEFIKLKTNL